MVKAWMSFATLTVRTVPVAEDVEVLRL